MYIFLLPTMVFLAAAPVCIRALLLRDRLFEALYTKHHPLWMELGRPTGWLWRPPKGGAFFPELTITFGMLGENPPSWLAGTPDLRDTYFACRRMARLWNFVAMPLCAGSMLVAMAVALFLRR